MRKLFLAAIVSVILLLMQCDKSAKDMRVENDEIGENEFNPQGDIVLLTEDWPPYNYINGNNLTGFSVEIVREIMKDLKLDIRIQVLPGARGEIYTQKRSNCMLFSLFRNAERDRHYKWIGPLAEEGVYFYKLKGSNLKINSVDDARKVGRIATRSEGVILEELIKRGFTNLDHTSTSEGQILKLIYGRADLIPQTPLSVRYRTKRMGYSYDLLEQTHAQLFKLPIYIACSKEMPDEIINRWNLSLKKLKASGKYKEIYNRYLYY